MRFFVLGDNDQKYGPADVSTLENWAKEGRLLAHTRLQNEMDGTIQSASQVVPGAFATVTPAAPPAAAAYPRLVGDAAKPSVSDEEAKRNALIGLGLGVLSMVILWFVGIGALLAWSAGMRMSLSAKDAKPGLGWTAFAVNLLAAILWVVVVIGSRFIPTD